MVLPKTVCYLTGMTLPVYQRVNRREETESPVDTVREP